METEQIIDVNSKPVVNETKETLEPTQVTPLTLTIYNGEDFHQSLKNTLAVIESSAVLIENAGAKKIAYIFIQEVANTIQQGINEEIAKANQPTTVPAESLVEPSLEPKTITE